MPVQVCWAAACDASPRVCPGNPRAHGSRLAPRLLCTAWFKFAQPWNLTAAHFAANATVGLKLAFDLAGMVKGVSTTRCGNTIYDNATGTDFQVRWAVHCRRAAMRSWCACASEGPPMRMV